MQPGQQKITQFDEVTSTQSGDVIPIVRGGQNKKISVENFTGVLPEGWLTPAEAWTFASFGNGVGVITIPEGNINRYPNGTRVWFKQGTPTATNRYGVVIGSTTTTLTVAMIAGTTLQNLAIQQPAVSSEVAPRTSENVDFTIQILGAQTEIKAGGNYTVNAGQTVLAITNDLGRTAIYYINMASGSGFTTTDRWIARLNDSSGMQIGNLVHGTLTITLNPGERLYFDNFNPTNMSPFMQWSARTIIQ